jgi:peptidyl-prolyl cis-trans isomerase B (cyclophilin B)
VRRTKLPFPINLIWNVKAFYVVFIVVMIASMAAVGLAPGLGSNSSSTGAPIDDITPLPEETAAAIASFERPEKTIDPAAGYKATLTTDQGDIVLELSADAPEAANSFAFLAGQDFYDGLAFYWVAQGFDAQAGDPTCGPEGLTCSGTGGPGYTLQPEGEAAGAKQWDVLAPPTGSGEVVHGSQFVVALADSDKFTGSVFARVVSGREVLEGLTERVPCFGSARSDSNPCMADGELPQALMIEDVIVEPA